MRSRRVGLAVAGGLFALAFAVRMALLKAVPYGDETAHYTMARTLGFLDSSVYWIDAASTFRLYPLVVARPVFALAHWPGAAFGFEGFRVLGIAYAALLPLLVYVLARQLRVRVPAAVLAGLVVALHPAFVVWGSRVFPDTLMADLVLGGLIAYVAGRTRLSAVLMLLACLAKETALPAAAGLAAHAVLVGLRPSPGGPSRWRRLQPAAWHVGATVLGTSGVVVSYLIVPRLPGWTSGGTVAQTLDALTLWPWLAIVPLLALWNRRLWPPAAALASTIAFYLAFVVLRDGNINGWYVLLPAALAVLLATAGFDQGMQSRAWPRMAAVTLGVAFVFAAVVAVVGSENGGPLLHPATDRGEAGLVASIGFVRSENPWLAEAIRFQQEESPARVLDLDLGWFWLSYPFRGADQTAFSFTVQYETGMVPSDDLVERAERADLTWLQDWNSTFHQAFKETYAECEVFAAGILTAYRIQDCPGRIEDLRQALALR